MQKITSDKSQKIIDAFIKNLKTGIKKNEILIEFFNLDLEEPIVERMFCAHIKATNNKEAILYEALERRCFYIKMELFEGESIPLLKELDKIVLQRIPKRILDKMYHVSISQRDDKITAVDFETPFSLSKP